MLKVKIKAEGEDAKRLLKNPKKFLYVPKSKRESPDGETAQGKE